MTGTKISEINEMIKIMLENFKSFSCLIEERKKIVMMPNKIKIKCLKKNEQSLVSSLSDTTNEVDANEKNNPIKNNKRIRENMNLSIFFHQS